MRLVDQYETIKCRADFFRELNEAIASSQRLLQRLGGDGVISSILRQLEAIRQWTDNGREPTQEERWKPQIGLILSREYPSVPDDEVEEWAERSRTVQGYFRRWLDDGVFRTVDTDEMPMARMEEDPATHLLLIEDEPDWEAECKALGLE